MSISAAASAFPIATTTIRRPSPEQYAKIVARHTAALGCKVMLEPGRLIVGNAGVLVASVIYLKKGENKHFVIVDAAMNDLVRPTLYDAHHEILPVKEPAPRAALSRRAATSSARSAKAAIIWRSTATCPKSRPAISSR